MFATSPPVTGRVYAADYAPPSPANLTTAIGDMELAFTDAAGRAPDVTELGAGDIGGLTLEPGVYAWGTGVSMANDITLAGSATDVWIFQMAQSHTLGARVYSSVGPRSSSQRRKRATGRSSPGWITRWPRQARSPCSSSSAQQPTL